MLHCGPRQVWEQLLEPLRALVPCEYVRIYVQAGLAETSPDHAGKPLGPFKAESLALAQHVRAGSGRERGAARPYVAEIQSG